MKRQIGGGTGRGPSALGRQRRTIRLVQVLMALLAVGLLTFAGYTAGRATGFEEGRRAAAIDAPAEPSTVQTVSLVVLGALLLGAAFALQAQGGLRMPTPARLDELATRAEATAIDRAARAAEPPAKS
ncbi:MAG: hypothetical protein GEU78_09090 [Actinobacteria bacterium]|nr:hypothetical protein [Actinomycetota bacterium]